MIYEWILVVLMFAADGKFSATYHGYHTQSDCRDMAEPLALQASDLRFDDGSKPVMFVARCEPLVKVPEHP